MPPCRSCGEPTLVTDARLAELYCPKCGTVIDEQQADTKGGLFEFDEKNPGARKLTRSVTSYLYPYKGIGSIMKGNPEEDSYARVLPAFHIAWGALTVPIHARLYSAILYRRCYRAKLTRGRSSEGMIAALVFIALSELDIRRDISNVAYSLDVDEHSMRRRCEKIASTLQVRSTPYRADVYRALEDVVRKLGIDISILGPAMAKIDEMISSKKIGRRKANVAAAVALYSVAKASKIKLDQNTISDAFKTSARGLRRLLN